MNNSIKTRHVNASVPGILFPLIRLRAKALGYRSVSGYLLGLVLFDLWCRKPHALTQQIVNEDSQEMREAVFSEIVSGFDRPLKENSYFEHRLKQMAEELAATKNAGV